MTHLSKLAERTPPVANANLRIWVMMTRRCEFIEVDEHSALGKDADSGGGYACVGRGPYWNSGFAAQYCYESKNGSNNEVYLAWPVWFSWLEHRPIN